MSTKFTPGPWLVCCGCGDILTDCNPTRDAEVIATVSPKNCPANAALVASAPDLYAAVEMLLDEVRILSHYGGLGDERQIGVGQSRIELARSILKKAGGG